MATLDQHRRMAAAILDFEARRDREGYLKVYKLPAGDGGGTYEVAGINERYNKHTADAFVVLIGQRKFTEAEALSVEFTETKRVLLFAADAQIGNRMSWQDTKWQVDGDSVTGPDLLARTIYYKVGHHGSHNAPARAKGLEQMKHPDLSAFIPTNAADAKTVGWGAMPYDKILAEHCAGRVVRADDEWAGKADGTPGFAAPSGSIRANGHGIGLWIEVELAWDGANGEGVSDA